MALALKRSGGQRDMLGRRSRLAILSRIWRGARDEAAAGLRFPIAILSFDRPHYLRAVVESLRPQISPSDPVILFQDGGYNRFSERQKGDPMAIRACVAIFKSIIPWGEVQFAADNLGIAANYGRAEHHLFEDLGAEAALILEDDLVLSPRYLDVLRPLLRIALQDERIGYVSAYGNLWASAREQHRHRRELLPMHENWGAAFTRKSWLAEQPLRQAFNKLLAGRDYSHRDHDAIKTFYAERGWTNIVTGQDSIRWISCVERGAIRLTTFTCHARYIGIEGDNSIPSLYRAARHGRSTIYDGRLPRLRPPSDRTMAIWLEEERARFQGRGKPFYPGHPL